METFLRGLLLDLINRCRIISNRISSADHPDIRSQALSAYRNVEILRREAAEILADQNFEDESFLTLHFRHYKRLKENADLIESYQLPFFERYNDKDHFLTRLCNLLSTQINWPHPPPLVCASSIEYFWSLPNFNFVNLPAAEGTSLLGLGDLCHEMGHILMFYNRNELLGNFIQEFNQYIREIHLDIDVRQRAPQYHTDYDNLYAAWMEGWLEEFTCDMVATYLVGPAFAYQHLRLCTCQEQGIFHPALGEDTSHPADEARMRASIEVLQIIGATGNLQELTSLWTTFLTLSGQDRPLDYDVCYPQHLVVSLANHVVAGCRQLGLHCFTDPETEENARPRVVSLVNQAWGLFRNSPVIYNDWERQEIERLMQDIN